MKKIYSISLPLLFLFSCANASDIIHFKLVNKIIQDINIKAKTVVIGNTHYPLRLDSLRNIYYLSADETINLNKLPLNRKYFIQFKFNNRQDYLENKNAYISYIGTLTPPF